MAIFSLVVIIIVIILVKFQLCGNGIDFNYYSNHLSLWVHIWVHLWGLHGCIYGGYSSNSTQINTLLLLKPRKVGKYDLWVSL